MQKVSLSQLRWACRRGMLELDILLGNFFTEGFHALSVAEQAVFAQLLACSDQDLLMWLMGKSIAPDPALALLITKMRAHAQC